MICTETKTKPVSQFLFWSPETVYEPIHYAEKLQNYREPWSRIYTTCCGSRGLLLTKDKDKVTCKRCIRKIEGEIE